jgi:hypothetical protein
MSASRAFDRAVAREELWLLERNEIADSESKPTAMTVSKIIRERVTTNAKPRRRDGDKTEFMDDGKWWVYHMVGINNSATTIQDRTVHKRGCGNNAPMRIIIIKLRQTPQDPTVLFGISVMGTMPRVAMGNGVRGYYFFKSLCAEGHPGSARQPIGLHSDPRPVPYDSSRCIPPSWSFGSWLG